MQLFDYSNLNFDTKKQLYFAGISYFPTAFTILGENTEVLYTNVKANEIYRPDKISQRLWQTPDLSWVLDLLNDFETGIREYSFDTELRYVTANRLRDVGII